MEQAQGDDTLAEEIIDELLAAFLRDGTLLPPIDILFELGVLPNITSNTFSELLMQIEVERCASGAGRSGLHGTPCCRR